MNEISENHKRAFNAIVTLTEKRLLDLEALITKYERCGSAILTLNPDVPGEVVNGIRKTIGEIRQTLVQFAFDYDLPGDDKSLKRELNIAASFLWEDLASAADHKFKGYGDLDRQVLDEVEERLATMIERVRYIMLLTS